MVNKSLLLISFPNVVFAIFTLEEIPYMGPIICSLTQAQGKLIDQDPVEDPSCRDSIEEVPNQGWFFSCAALCILRAIYLCPHCGRYFMNLSIFHYHTA